MQSSDPATALRVQTSVSLNIKLAAIYFGECTITKPGHRVECRNVGRWPQRVAIVILQVAGEPSRESDTLIVNY